MIVQLKLLKRRIKIKISYQECLDFLKEHAMEFEEDYDWDENPCGEYKNIEWSYLKQYVEPLQELIDKNTPIIED